jgi:hypothetical protein
LHGIRIRQSVLDYREYNLRILDAMARSKKPGMPLEVYEQLWELHVGFDQVRHALEGLGQHRTFHATELERLGAWLEEARAATASYLTGAIEEAETNEAGRLFRLRRVRERKEE